MGNTEREKARRIMARIAREMNRAHYVHGAKGARPGQKDGAPIRPNSVTLEMITDPNNPSFFAATCTPSFKKDSEGNEILVNGKPVGDKHVCAGIYLGMGGTIASPTDKIMIDYLKSQELSDTAKCWTKAGLTPRRIQGSREKNNSIVWGESCDGWRHFDCIGLVEYSLQFVYARGTVGGEIWQFASPNNVLGAKHITDTNDVMEGDLVSKFDDGKYHHIGIIYFDNGQSKIAQANETSVGVTIKDVYDSASWSGGRWRLPDSLLKPDSEVSEEIPSNGWQSSTQIKFKIV